MHLKRSIVAKISHPPPDPLKYVPHKEGSSFELAQAGNGGEGFGW